ncbi:MAG: hypothetical protein U1D97_02050 [Desulfuromonadales bacterium]|nr:hypothetical protein [Desulfuromonadales bacterium]
MSKKFEFVSLSVTLLTFLLLTLAGCDSSSDPKAYYQATGSWSGTIGADRVRGIIAPDGSAQLAIVDVNGEFIGDAGEYVGRIGSVNPDNIGSMSLTRLQGGVSSGGQNITFKLSADRLYSEQGIELTRTAESNGPAVLSDVVGRWSLSAADNLTAVVVDESGTLSGGNGQCQYSGSMQLIDPAWNIYRLALTVADITYLSCPQRDVSYTGLAMKLGNDETRPRLWFAANSLAKTAQGEWSKTINVAPVAQMAILGDRTSPGLESSVLVKEGAAVELNAQGSSDVNNDPLTYSWSGTDPLGGTLTMTVAPGTGSTATFIPVLTGVYTINLTVSDGIATASLIRPLSVEWTPDRFVDCINGTVLDTKTNLLWLQDAECTILNQGTIWGISHAEAETRVGTLTSGVCNLNDNSEQGNWHLPTLDDFSYIIPQSQWSEGNRFVHVGTTLPYYWTADPDPETEFNWFFVDVSGASTEWFGSYFENTATAVWPVRAMRSGETCP